MVVKNRVSDFRVIGGPPVLLKLFLSTTPHIRDKNVLAKFKLDATAVVHCNAMKGYALWIKMWKFFKISNLPKSLKFMFSKKAAKIDKIFAVDLTFCSKCQMDNEDLVDFCGLWKT